MSKPFLTATIGVPALDEEHQELFRSCSKLQRAVAAGAPLREMQSIVNALMGHITAHFSHEERQMRKTGYSLYAWHRRQQQAARHTATLLVQRVDSGDRQAARELGRFLAKWLNEHIPLADRLLAGYLRSHQRELAARA